MKRKKVIIRIIAILFLLFSVFNCYRGFDNNIIPVALSFMLIAFISLLTIIKPTLLID